MDMGRMMPFGEKFDMNQMYFHPRLTTSLIRVKGRMELLPGLVWSKIISVTRSLNPGGVAMRVPFVLCKLVHGCL